MLPRSPGDAPAPDQSGHARHRGVASIAGPPEVPPAGPALVDPEPEPRKRRRWRRVALIVGLSLLAVIVGIGVGGWLYMRSVDGSIERVDAFTDVPQADRPAKVVAGAENLLILGSDSRNPDTTGSRTDTIIVAHIPADHSKAQLISIPRDTWVHVPKSKDGRHGGTNAKINAAFAWGGAPLMVQTVESFTGVRIDHVMMIDFSGFKDIVDALGGIEIDVDRTFTSIHPPHRRFVEGHQRMDGATALDYSRQRKQFPDGDFTRIKHQQQVIRAVVGQAAGMGLLTDPPRLNAFVRATADSMTVDETFSTFDMAMKMRGVRGGDLAFMTSPSSGTGRVGDQSVVFADKTKAASLYDAVKRDAVDQWLATNG
jgi:LCP family protein required for cell wall assembly